MLIEQEAQLTGIGYARGLAVTSCETSLVLGILGLVGEGIDGIRERLSSSEFVKAGIVVTGLGVADGRRVAAIVLVLTSVVLVL